MALFVTWLFNTAFAVLASTIITVLGFFNSLYDIKVTAAEQCMVLDIAIGVLSPVLLRFSLFSGMVAAIMAQTSGILRDH
eukprot:2438408-Amphidinium_carterae.1